MIEAILLGAVAAVWAFVEIQWCCDDRWALQIYRPSVCAALAEVAADEERWS